MATIQNIKQRAQQVKDATQIGENTANRVGGVLVDIADHLEQDENKLSSLYPADAVPTAGSTKPVQSGGVQALLSQLLPMDEVPTPNSVKPVQSGGVFREVADQIMTQFGGRFGVKNLSDITTSTPVSSVYFDNIVDGKTTIIDKSSSSYASTYRVVYRNEIIKKGTVIHFTGTTTTARAQYYGATQIEPGENIVGMELDHCYVKTANGQHDDWFIMPYDGYFFYAFYNQDWSNRLFEVVEPSNEILAMVDDLEGTINRVSKLLSSEIINYTEYNYGVNTTGKYGTNTAYKHGCIAVEEGEQFIIESNSNNTNYAFVTSDTCSAGGNIPLVVGTSVINIPYKTSVVVTIPEGTSYLVFGSKTGYNTKIYKYLEIEIDETPKRGSQSLVTSGGVFKEEVEQIMTQFGGRFGVKGIAPATTVTSVYFGDIVDERTTIIAKEESAYRVIYRKEVFKKGTVIHFTGTTTSARAQYYGVTQVEPGENIIGMELDHCYVANAIGQHDDWFMMPYDGYFFYAYFNQTWSDRHFDVVVPEPYENKVVDDFINRPYFKQDAQQLVGQWQTNDASVWDISGVDGNNATLTNVTQTGYKYVGFYVGNIPIGVNIHMRFKCDGPLNGTGDMGVFNALSWQSFVVLKDINGNIVPKDTFGYIDIIFRRENSQQNWIVLSSNSFSSGSTFVISEFSIETITYIDVLDANLRKEIDDVNSEVKKAEGYAGSIIPPVYTHETYMNISTVAQGSCVYGNYLFGASAANSEGVLTVKVFDLESKVLTDTLTLSGVATNTHANTLSFGKKFDDNDEFPCLYIPTGYTNDGASDVYVCRITGTVGNLAISIVQTIHLWGEWTDFFCGENNMAWVKTGTSAAMRFRCYSLPELGESVVTIDPEQTLMDFTLPPQKFGFGVTKSDNQNFMYYKGKIWFVSGVPSRDTKDCTYIAVVDVRSQCLDCVVWLDDVGLTNGSSNTYEPESVFIWNNQLYVVFRTFISKIIRVNLT